MPTLTSRARLVAILLSLAFGAGGCAALSPSEAPGMPSLEGSGWRAVTVGGRQPLAGREPTIAFSGGTVRGSTGCNTFGGTVKIQGTQITFGGLNSTLIGCEGPVAEIEALYPKLLAGSNQVDLRGLNLVLRGPAGEIVFRPDATVR